MIEYVRNHSFMLDNPSLAPNLAISHSSALITPTEGLLDLWLHGKSPHTQRYYRREALKFLGIVNKPIELITLADVQGYVTALNQSSLAVSSVARAIAAIKSLFTFAHQKTGLLKANPAGAVTLPKVKDSLAVITTNPFNGLANGSNSPQGEGFLGRADFTGMGSTDDDWIRAE